jgi:hypothetical protein
MNKILVTLLLAALLVPVGPVRAQDNQPVEAGDESNPDRKPSLDVFRVLIKQETPPPPIIQPTLSSSPAPPPPPPPLQFSVKAIAGEAPHYVAVLNYNNNDFIVEEGWESEDNAFTVKKIGPNKAGEIEVEVYNKKTNRLAHKAYKEPKIPGFTSGGEAPAGADAGADAGLGGDAGLDGGMDGGGGMDGTGMDGGGMDGGGMDGGGMDGGTGMDGGDAGGLPPP